MTTRFKVGDPYRPLASDLNAYADAVDRINALGTRLPKKGNVETIQIQNNSGVTLDKHFIAHLGAPLLATTNPDDPGRFKSLHTATALVAASWGRFAVAQKPLIVGAIGPAVIRGLTIVTLDRQYDWHEWADITPATPNKLTSAPHGSAEILWASGSTGSSLQALVAIGPRRQVSLRAKADSTLSPDTSGLFNIWRSVAPPAAPTVTSYQVTAQHIWMSGTKDIDTTTAARVTFDPQELIWEVTEAECPP